MFVSTVIPSTMFNIQRNLNKAPYNFSIPYNFIRGRDIIINFSPPLGDNTGTQSALNILNEVYGITNRLNVTIPDNVTEYTVTKEFILRQYFNSGYNFPAYTVEIKFDLTLGIITFTPLSVRALSGSLAAVDTGSSTAVLLTISTII